jgi:hypothetical protein
VPPFFVGWIDVGSKVQRHNVEDNSLQLTQSHFLQRQAHGSVPTTAGQGNGLCIYWISPCSLLGKHRIA